MSKESKEKSSNTEEFWTQFPLTDNSSLPMQLGPPCCAPCNLWFPFFFLGFVKKSSSLSLEVKWSKSSSDVTKVRALFFFLELYIGSGFPEEHYDGDWMYVGANGFCLIDLNL